MITKTEKDNYNGIDIFKFTAACLIIFLHTIVLSDNSAITFIFRNNICTFAVPYFFAISGYFFYRIKNNKTKVLERIKHIYSVYIFWTIIYLPFVIIKYVFSNKQDYWLNYVKRFFLEGSYETIWFLNALGIATALYYLLSKKLSSKKIFVISLILYVMGCLLSSYVGLLNRIPGGNFIVQNYYSMFESVKNGLFFGIPFFCIGNLIYKYKNSLVFTTKKLVICLIIFLLISIVENYYRITIFGTGKSSDLYFTLIPMTFILIILSITIKIVISNDLSLYLRKMSTLMFLTQRIFITCIIWSDNLFKTKITANTFIYFISVFLATFCFSNLFLLLTKKIPFIKKFI